MGTTATSSGSGGSGDPIIGRSCLGQHECDDKTYCHADDRDCGRGHCLERPSSPHGVEVDLYCGCDGELYGTENAALFNGIDIGKNTRCETTPGVNWRCGDRILCGFKPCAKANYPDAVCNPVGACDRGQYLGWEACLYSQEDGYYCDLLGFVVKSCEDKRILDICNGCVDAAPCGSDNTHKFTSTTCTEDACQLRTVECIK